MRRSYREILQGTSKNLFLTFEHPYKNANKDQSIIYSF